MNTQCADNRGNLPGWALGPFYRSNQDNPILRPDKELSFSCPLRKKPVEWAALHVFNPAAVVKDGEVNLLYRAEDANGDMKVGGHTSRIGLTWSSDGIHFTKKRSEPVLYPDEDGQKSREWPTGCEDPRIVMREDGLFIMTYTQSTGWHEEEAKWSGHLGVATSLDLVHWKKLGPAFANNEGFEICDRAGSIVCRQDGERFIAVKIDGCYWMYWHNGTNGVTYAAKSNDLLSWTPVRDASGALLPILSLRRGYFDSGLVEPGPQAILRKEGILLLYNGANSENPQDADPSLSPGAYSSGQALFDKNNPARELARLDHPFLVPSEAYEKVGQCACECIFIEGLVYYKGQYLLYYGGTDAVIGVATCAS